MHDILLENKPAYLELSAGDDGKSLIVATHSNLTQVINESQIQPSITVGSFEYKFLPISDKWPWWGFGPVFDRLPPQKPNWDYWKCPLPKVMTYPPHMQRQADLEYYSIHDQMPQPNFYWQHAFGISATFGSLFRTAEYLTKPIEVDPTETITPQLMDLNLITDVGMHGAELSVTFGMSMLPWLSRQRNDSQNRRAEEVMKKAYNYMSDSESNRFDKFNVLLREGRWINLSCPGNACGLNPGSYDHFADDRGYKLSSHNVDSPMQQLTLIMGLASIQDQVRQSQLYT